MSIEEEIKILENALSGALLVPSECAFVSTEIIKICLDTLKTYESWENLIRYEIEKQIRADAIDEFVKKICEKYTKEESKGNYKQYCVEIKQNIADIAAQLKVKEQKK